MQNNHEQLEQDVSTPADVQQNPILSNIHLSSNGQDGGSSDLVSHRSELSEKVVTFLNETWSFALILCSYIDRKKLSSRDFKKIRAHLYELFNLHNEIMEFITQDSFLMDEEVDIISYDFHEMIANMLDYCINNNQFYYIEDSSGPEGSEFENDSEPEKPEELEESELTIDFLGEPVFLINDLSNDKRTFPIILSLTGNQTKRYLKCLELQLRNYEICDCKGLIFNEPVLIKKRKVSFNIEYYKEQILTILKEEGSPMKSAAIHKKIKVDPGDPNGKAPALRNISDYILMLIAGKKVESVSINGRNGYVLDEEGRTYRLKH